MDMNNRESDLEHQRDKLQDDLDEAQHFIDGYGRLPCSTVGSIVLTDIQSGKRVAGVDTATIHFDTIPQTVIDRLLEEGMESTLVPLPCHSQLSQLSQFTACLYLFSITLYSSFVDIFDCVSTSYFILVTVIFFDNPM